MDPICNRCGHPDYNHGRYADWKFWRRHQTWCEAGERIYGGTKRCRCRHYTPPVENTDD